MQLQLLSTGLVHVKLVCALTAGRHYAGQKLFFKQKNSNYNNKSVALTILILYS